MDAMNLIDALQALGYQVLFTSDAEFAGPFDYRDTLEAHQVTCISASNAHRSTPSFTIAVHGSASPSCRACTAAVISTSVSASHVRMPRWYSTPSTFIFFARGATPNWIVIWRDCPAPTTRVREMMLVRECDATLVVSSAEREMLATARPDARIFQIPLARKLTPPEAGFRERSGIGFIGGFEHAPNVDAIRWFLREVWPLLRAAVPGCEFSIVGRSLPDELRASLPGGVHYLGPLPDLSPWFESLLVTVAPLRFGAGAKGKVASSLAAGVPCVATSIAVEGMALLHDRDVMVADHPLQFVQHLDGLLNNESIWRRHSQAAFQYAEKTLGPSSVTQVVKEVCQSLGRAPVPSVD